MRTSSRWRLKMNLFLLRPPKGPKNGPPPPPNMNPLLHWGSKWIIRGFLFLDSLGGLGSTFEMLKVFLAYGVYLLIFPKIEGFYGFLVAVKEPKLSYHNRYYILSNRASPME